MGKYTKYDVFDVVMPKGRTEGPSGVILDYDFRREGLKFEVLYEIFAGGKRQWVRQADVERIGRFPTPLRHGQSVIVLGSVLGRKRNVRGLITGIAWKPETNEWGYTVQFMNGMIIAVTQDEVRPPHHKSDYVEREYSQITKEAKRQLVQILRKKKEVLLPGVPAPRSGVYDQIGTNGRTTKAYTLWREGDPLPSPSRTGRGWVFRDPNGTIAEKKVIDIR